MSELSRHGRPTRVTVIMPFFNENKASPSVVIGVRDALLEASYAPRLLLVDDGSDDDSLLVAAGLASLHEDISYISFPRNFGKDGFSVRLRRLDFRDRREMHWVSLLNFTHLVSRALPARVMELFKLRSCVIN